MAVSICHCNAKVVAKNIGANPNDRRFLHSKVDSAAVYSMTTGETTLPIAQGKDKSVNELSTGFVRWAAVAAAAAASVSLLSAAPEVLAAEREAFNGVATESIHGDVSLRIAIPIPNPETWTYSQYGFLAPPPRSGGEVAVVSNYQGGCPAWQPSQFEMIVPDGVHPKHNPRHGSQWPALYTLEEATIDYPAVDSKDPSVKYASLIDALLRMSDAGLTCFSL